MSAWLPEKGDLFYVESLRMRVDAPALRDRQFYGTIFRMVAHDDLMLIADEVYCSGVYIEKVHRCMLPRSDFKAIPVGPAVVEALFKGGQH